MNRREANRKACLGKYGMRPFDYGVLLGQQGGGCALCGAKYSPRGAEKQLLGVDHHHGTGVVRGLLCHFCNILIGMLERLALVRGDYDLAAASAVAYLKFSQTPYRYRSSLLAASRKKLLESVRNQDSRPKTGQPSKEPQCVAR